MTEVRVTRSNLDMLTLMNAVIQPQGDETILPPTDDETRRARYVSANDMGGYAPTVDSAPADSKGTPEPPAQLPPQIEPSPRLTPGFPELSPLLDAVNLRSGEAVLDGREVTLEGRALDTVRRTVALAVARKLRAEARAVLSPSRRKRKPRGKDATSPAVG